MVAQITPFINLLVYIIALDFDFDIMISLNMHTVKQTVTSSE